MNTIVNFIIVFGVVVVGIILQALIIWGIGLFVIKAFSLDITFTFLQAVALSLLLGVINMGFQGVRK